MQAAVVEVEDIYRPIKKDCRCRKRESTPIGGENVPWAAVAEGWNFRGATVAAAKMNRPPDSKGFRQPIRDTADSRFGGGENGKGADTAEERMEPEPTLRKEG